MSSITASIGASDVIETQDAMYFKMDVPGLSKADIKVRLHDDTLTISGERLVEPLLKDGHAVRSERHFGPFSRYVT